MSRVRSGVFVGVGVLAIGLGTPAQTKGQSRAARPGPAKPAAAEVSKAPGAPTAAAESKETDSDAASANDDAAPASNGAASGDDLGARPPKRTQEKPGTQPSPLTPGPGEFPALGAKPPPVAYDKLLADIAALRSRVAAVTATLFSSKLRVVVELEGDDVRVASFRVLLDDGVVYSAPERFSADQPLVVYERAVASGHHVVGVEIERYAAQSRQFRTFQTSKFAVVVPEGKRLETSLRIEDDSGMGEDFPEDQDGEYDLRVRLRARVID